MLQPRIIYCGRKIYCTKETIVCRSLSVKEKLHGTMLQYKDVGVFVLLINFYFKLHVSLIHYDFGWVG